MKLSDYARNNGITYQTAYNWWKSGNLKGKQFPSGTIIINEADSIEDTFKKCILYARVSTSEQKEHIDRQLERLRLYAVSNGYVIVEEHKEIASGLNDNRRILNKIIQSNNWNVLVVEHKDRLTRFGFKYIEQFLNYKNQKIEVINLNEKENLMDDFVSIITCFCAKIYGKRGNVNRVKKILEEVDEK